MTREIVDRIQAIAKSYSATQIFSDWVLLMAIALQNQSTIHTDKLYRDREQMYLDTMKKYDEKERRTFVEMFHLLVKCFDENIDDYLGRIYMESESGRGALGQFFSPFHVSEMVAKVAMTDWEEGTTLVINEPSCGSGGMMLASAKNMLERGYNPQKFMKITASDLDWTAVYMTYTQLSICGLNGVVIQQDTLRMDSVRPEQVFRTYTNLGGVLV